jgi:transcriptional regulator GlxA family with amidase domain
MTEVSRVAYLVFPGITTMDFIGVYEALRHVPQTGAGRELSHRVIGTEETIGDEEGGVVLRPDGVYEDLDGFDLLVVPGGFGTRKLMEDERCLEYLRGWGDERPLASVCTGALLLGASGHLEGRRATTHHTAFDLLAPYCREVLKDRRIVRDGYVVTAGGVTSSLDLGLYLVERFWGAGARQWIAAQMEYRAYSAV